MELFSFGFMLVLGLKFLFSTSVPGADSIGEKLETKLHPHTAFMTGFVRVMGNPGVLLGWIILGAYFISHELVAPTWAGKAACVAGVALGTGSWFMGLRVTPFHLGHKKLRRQNPGADGKGFGDRAADLRGDPRHPNRLGTRPQPQVTRAAAGIWPAAEPWRRARQMRFASPCGDTPHSTKLQIFFSKSLIFCQAWSWAFLSASFASGASPPRMKP